MRSALRPFAFILYVSLVGPFAVGQDSPAEPTAISGWCGTARIMERARAARGASSIGCEWVCSICDTPSVRDSCISDSDQPMTWIRVYLHFLAGDDDCIHPIQPWHIDEWTRDANALLAPYRIGLRFEADTICDSRYFVFGPGDDTDLLSIMARTYSVDPGRFLNVYFIVGPYSFALSPCDYEPDAFQHYVIMSHMEPNFFVHELGHALGLWHTFAGVDETQYSSAGKCGPCQEIPGADNRDRNGDFCSDTEATPNLHGCIQPEGVDSCQQIPWGYVAPGNLMSYQLTGCSGWFSPQQTGRMFCWINNGMPGWVAHLEIDTAAAAYGQIPVTASFTGWCPEQDCEWIWEFGDGSSGSGPAPSHTFDQPGVYSVTATVTNVTGAHSAVLEDAVLVAADTVSLGTGLIDDGHGYVEVSLRNYVPVNMVQIPFRWDGPLSLTFDSVSVSGLRGDVFDWHKPVSVAPGLSRATVALRALGSAGLEPGDGPIARLHFTLASHPGESTVTNPVSIFEYSSYRTELGCPVGYYLADHASGGMLIYDCCEGTVGDANGDGAAAPSIGDVSTLIDHLFISQAPLICYAEADVNQSGGLLPASTDITISDISTLIDFLFITAGTLADCR